MNKDAAHIRLLQAIEYLKNNGMARNHEEISGLSGVSRPNVTAAINGNFRYVTEGFIRRFARAYAEFINEDWLLSGVGKMEKIDTQKLKLHIPADKAVVSAGFVGAAIGSVREDECELKQVIPYLPRYDYTIHVKGDSMFPTILNGDIVACERLDGGVDFKEDKIYILDTDSGAAIKRVRRLGNSLICHSDNPEYSDFTIQSIEHIRIARVVGVVREL